MLPSLSRYPALEIGTAEDLRWQGEGQQRLPVVLPRDDPLMFVRGAFPDEDVPRLQAAQHTGRHITDKQLVKPPSRVIRGSSTQESR
jgi:hypothetical protein